MLERIVFLKKVHKYVYLVDGQERTRDIESSVLTPIFLIFPSKYPPYSKTKTF